MFKVNDVRCTNQLEKAHKQRIKQLVRGPIHICHIENEFVVLSV